MKLEHVNLLNIIYFEQHFKHTAQCKLQTAPANAPAPAHFILHIEDCTRHAIHLILSAAHL